MTSVILCHPYTENGRGLAAQSDERPELSAGLFTQEEGYLKTPRQRGTQRDPTARNDPVWRDMRISV